MKYWPLSDIQVLIASILGLTLVLLVTLSSEKAKVTRREFARLQEELKRLSENVKTLQFAVLKLSISKAGPSTEQDSLRHLRAPYQQEEHEKKLRTTIDRDSLLPLR